MNHQHPDPDDLGQPDSDALPPLFVDGVLDKDEAWRAMAEMEAFWLLFPEL